MCIASIFVKLERLKGSCSKVKEVRSMREEHSFVWILLTLDRKILKTTLCRSCIESCTAHEALVPLIFLNLCELPSLPRPLLFSQ